MQILEQASFFNKQSKKQDESFNPQHFLARAIKNSWQAKRTSRASAPKMSIADDCGEVFGSNTPKVTTLSDFFASNIKL